MPLFGLIGFPLTHSCSSAYFTEKFRRENLSGYNYRLFPLKDPSGIRKLLDQNPGLCGLNVTIPLKETIMPFLDEFDEQSTKAGAVNTIKIGWEHNRQKLTGYNTDIDGFLSSADFSSFSHALILGTGGASNAIAYSLKKLGIRFILVSRKPTFPNSLSYHELDREIVSRHTLIINTTPVGMFPKTGNYPPIPYEYLTANHMLYDLIYNPEETLFLQKGREMGSLTQNGLNMFFAQANFSYQIWAHPVFPRYPQG
ncbi:MAG: shikimate dehydrogenase [Bacteroidales bacterium]|nr:shikimate dehydrogenase [Bacteroidales bacterium]